MQATRTGWAMAVVIDLGALLALRASGLAWRDAQLAAFAAGVLVLAGTSWATRAGRQRGQTLTLRPWTFLFVALLALFVRGGLVGWLLPVGAPALLVGATVTGSWLVFHALAGLLHTGDGAPWPLAETRWVRILQGLIAYTILLRLVYLQPVELLHEEAYYWLYAQHLACGYLDHPPLVAWLIALTTEVFGQCEFGVRIGAWLLWLGTAAFVHGLTRRIFDRLTAWVAVSLLAFLPFYFGIGVVMTPDAPLLCCWAGALYFAYRAILEDDRKACLAFGLCLGVGLLAKYTIGFLGLGALLFVVVDPESRVWLRRWQTWAAMALAILVFSPVLLWNAQHDWLSFGYQVGGRLTGSFRFSLHKLFGSALFILTPAGLVALWAAWRRGRAYGPLSERRRAFRLMAMLTLVPLLVLIVLSTVRSTKLNWTGPLWLGFFPYLAHWTIRSVERIQGARHVRLRPSMIATGIVFVVLLYGAGLYHLSVAWPGLSYPHNLGGTGWRAIGTLVEDLADEGERETGERPLVVGMYGDTTASWATFYRMRAARDTSPERAVRETVGRHLFGEWSHMFEHWFCAEGLERDSLLLVGQTREDVELPWVAEYVERMSDIHTYVPHKNGRPTGEFFYRWAFGYAWHPPTPR